MSTPARSPAHTGVTIAGSGSCLPARRVTNQDLMAVMDTSDEWIVQRTGIHTRHIHDEHTESTSHLATEATRAALKSAGLAPTDLDLIIVASMTPDAPTPSVACTVAHHLDARTIAAFDVNAACSGFVYAINMAHAMIAASAGTYRNVAVIGADNITRFCEFSTWGRGVSVLFGDAAAAVILRATDDTSKGLIAHALHSDGSGAKNLFIASRKEDFPPNVEFEERKVNRIHMDGQAVFKFAVGTFPKLIEETLDKANLRPEDVDHYVCHQSNYRILNSARDRFGLPPEKLHVNIDHFGNTVGASVPLVFNELREAGRVKEGQKVMFLAFGAGLTWASSLWQL